MSARYARILIALLPCLTLACTGGIERVVAVEPKANTAPMAQAAPASQAPLATESQPATAPRAESAPTAPNALMAEGERPITEIQGAGHFSPYDGQEVQTRGVVTFLDPKVDDKTRRRFFWIEDPQEGDDLARSRGLFVDAPLDDALTPDDLAPGDLVILAGKVEERGKPTDLPLTTLVAGKVKVLAHEQPLPPPILIGRAGRRPPGEVFEDDGLRRFEPTVDGLDFWENLESMRVAVRSPRITGPTLLRNEFVVLADSGRDATVTSRSGGVVVRPGDDNPERIIVSGKLKGRLPEARVGDQITADLPGIVDFAYGNYRLLATSTDLTLNPALLEPEHTLFQATENSLTVATFNVENLSARSDDARFTQLAEQIVQNLKSPDILGLQEIQDDSGPDDDGVVSADSTLGKLIAAIAAAGGPRYEFRQVDPVDNSGGGQPGANIRTVFLFQPARLSAPVLRPNEERIAERDGKKIEPLSFRLQKESGRLRFSHSPYRLDHSAFEADPARGWSASRKPLLFEAQFRGHDLYLINAHLRSKGGDDALGSRTQPPNHASEDQRSVQAMVIRRWVDEILDLDWEANVIVLGDMNEHEFRTPMRILAGTRMKDLIESVPITDRYTFNYLGNAQVLDHIFTSPNLFSRAQAKLDILHINSDFPEKERASDHDPLVLKLTFAKWANQR